MSSETVGWLRRLLHSGRSPLARSWDRWERLLVVCCVVIALAAIPVVAVGSSAEYAERVDRVAEQRQSRVATVAVLQENAPAPGGIRRGPHGLVQLRASWETPAGEIRQGRVPARHGAQKGTEITIWIDSQGKVTYPPLTHTDIVVIAVVSAALRWLGLVVALSVVVCLVRMLLDRARYAAWDREWRGLSGKGL
ncbi:hypothetical protein [Haloechinothrix salitolerans]|uniref:Transmembrane protein n=1 Tax=Haloechinothrix salitolerans TaxID=926830 RepID=A0ABW2C4I3_9PSEU